MPVGFVSLFILQHFSMLMCYHDNMITHKTDFVNPHSDIGEISSFVTKSFWASINYLILANYSKVQFYKNSTNSLALSHLGHSNSFASCKALCVLISASLPKTPFPERGYISGATAPSPCWGLRLKARMLFLLAISFARCKTIRASNFQHPIL